MVELGVIGRILLPVVSRVWLRNYAVWLDKGCVVIMGRKDWRIEEANSDDRLGQIKKYRQVKWCFPEPQIYTQQYMMTFHTSFSDDCVNEH
jgi:hypothetical protein